MRGASRASGRSGLSASIASTSNTRSIAASDRCSSENELTMFQTGLSSRNVYHWNAMMSPIDARPAMFSQPPYQTITTFTPLSSRPHDVQSTSSRRCANSSLRSTVCRPRMYSSSSRRLAAERAHDANARERFADAAVDLLGVLSQRAIDRTHAPREREAHQHDAGNDRERGEREAPVQRQQHGDGDDQPNDRDRRRHAPPSAAVRSSCRRRR